MRAIILLSLMIGLYANASAQTAERRPLPHEGLLPIDSLTDKISYKGSFISTILEDKIFVTFKRWALGNGLSLKTEESAIASSAGSANLEKNMIATNALVDIPAVLVEENIDNQFLSVSFSLNYYLIIDNNMNGQVKGYHNLILNLKVDKNVVKYDIIHTGILKYPERPKNSFEVPDQGFEEWPVWDDSAFYSNKGKEKPAFLIYRRNFGALNLQIADIIKSLRKELVAK